MIKRVPAEIAVAVILFSGSCTQTQPLPAPSAQLNTVKDLSFAGGKFEGGKLHVNPDYRVEPAPEKNIVYLRPQSGIGIKVSCYCILEGGDCWAVTTERPDGVGVGCASQNCAGGEEPFCFMDIFDDTAGFKVRLTVANRQ